MKLYKLTDENGCTRGNTKWGENVTHSATGPEDQGLCSNGWIHAYTHPLLAVLLNPIHGNFTSPQLYEAEGEVGKSDNGLKVGCRTLTTVKQIPLPELTKIQRIAFGILCVKEVCKDKKWNKWADNWLSGKDRTAYAADAATRAVDYDTYAATRAVAYAYDADATAYATADTAARAAYAAAYAADHDAADALDLIAIAEKCLEY